MIAKITLVDVVAVAVVAPLVVLVFVRCLLPQFLGICHTVRQWRRERQCERRHRRYVEFQRKKDHERL